MLKNFVIPFCLIILFLFQGCSRFNSAQVVSETDEQHYQRGQRLLREGRESEALSAFLKVIEKRRDAAESHLEAGRLYGEHIGDPVAAIYHFRKFLEQNPNSTEAPMVKQLIETSKKKFARQLPGQPMDSQIDRLDLLELLEEMRRENMDLKKKVVVLQAQISQERNSPTAAVPESVDVTRLQAPNLLNSRSNARPAPTPQPQVERVQPRMAPNTREYTVQSGDTLSAISFKVYGTRGRWLEIFQANRDKLESPDALKVGYVLRIP